MASLTMTANFLGGSAVAAQPKQPSATVRPGSIVIPKALNVTEAEKTVTNIDISSKEETSNGRRELMLAVAAAAACSIAKVALADEPKRGTKEAKKKYAPVCVTMPTASICHK